MLFVVPTDVWNEMQRTALHWVIQSQKEENCNKVVAKIVEHGYVTMQHNTEV